MTAITISRQLGSLGDQVAESVARYLGFQVLEREVINRAAHKAGAPEVALAVIDDLGLLDLRPSARAVRTYQRAMRQVLQEFAEQGSVVIVGRAGCVLLGGRAEVLHVRIIAPVALRVERVAEMQRISKDAAQAQVEASDKARRAYLRRHYKADWQNPLLYDLVLNTQRCSVPAATELICLALARCCVTPHGSQTRQESDFE